VSPRLASYSYIEVSVASAGKTKAAEVRSRHLLEAMGVPSSQIVTSSNPGGKSKVSFYTRSFRLAGKIRKAFETIGEKGFALRMKTLSREDWFDKWKADYPIMPLGSKFTLVPWWERKKYAEGRRMPLFLDPESSFGAGTHETTRLMVMMMERLRGKFESFLDVGTGTGILSVAAFRLGVRKIAGVDCRADSARTAKRNLQKNGCLSAKFFSTGIEKFKQRERFELVAANISSEILVRHKGKIFPFVSRGKYLAVSGMLRQNLKGFRREFKPAGFRCIKVFKGRKWCGILYKRSS